MKKLIIFSLLLFTLSGCSIFDRPKPEIVYIQPKPLVCSAYVKPDPINMLPVELSTIEVTEVEKKVTYLTISMAAYENVSINNKNMLSYIKQQKAILQYFKDCIDRYNESNKENDNSERDS